MGKEDYKNEKKGHGFLCVPKELLFDNRYKQLTIEAILLYAYMLDRLKLSIENGWEDSDGKVFIYFSLESIMDLLKCSKGKAISTLKELDEKHGIGLIEKKRSGYGKCSRIYVKEIFELFVSENEKTREKNEEDLEVTNKKHEKSKNKMSRSSKIEPIEVKKINPNNTNKSNTKSNHIFRKDMEEKITIEQQIRTNLTDEDSQTNYTYIWDNVKAHDLVTYEGLIAGKTYKLTGTLVEKSTGKTFVDANGKTATITQTFTPDSDSGSVDMVFDINPSNLKTSALVAFETLNIMKN